MIYGPSKTYFEMLRLYKAHKTSNNCLHFFNEGGSRSGKTFDTFDLIADFCHISPRPLEIYVFRDTLTDCKDFTYTDFRKKMQLRGEYDPANAFAENSRPDYRIKDSKIMFRGLDKFQESEGFDCDIVFINEILSGGISKGQYENVTMRCKLMTIADWNPKFTRHWVFDLQGRPDTFFTHTTFRDNPHAPPSVVQKILSYEPTDANIAAGTADDYRWKVYGLGQRAAAEGLIFPRITWIDKFPDNLEHVVHGMDFGFTNDPTVLVRGAVRDNNLYLEELFRCPVAGAADLHAHISPHFDKNAYVYADSADKYAKNSTGQIEALQMMGLPVIPAKKYSGSVVDGIHLMQNFNIHIVRNRDVEIEANSYVWAEVHGIPINYPIDSFNHFWDASRYMVLMELRYLFTDIS